MSDVNSLFGMGGGSGVFVGGYTVGNSALPDILVDGITVHIKTGVIALATAYPNAPTFALPIGSRWSAGAAMPVAMISGAFQYATARNGATVLMYNQIDFNTFNQRQYLVSADGGENFTLANLPASPCNIRDMIYVNGFFWLLLKTNSSSSALWRSATGVAGTWTQVWTNSSNVSACGVAYGNTRMVISSNPGSGPPRFFISTNSEVATPTWTQVDGNVLTNNPDSGQIIAAYPRIRYGKPNGPTDTDKFFLLGGTYVCYNTTPEVSGNWSRQGIAYNYAAGNATGWNIQGSGNVWAINGGQNNSYLTTNIISATSASVVSEGSAGQPAFANYDGNYWFIGGVQQSGATAVINVFDASGVSLSRSLGFFPAGAGLYGAGAVSHNNVVYAFPVTGTTTAKSLAAGNYTNTEKALYGPAYNAAGVFQADSRLFMRVA